MASGPRFSRIAREPSIAAIPRRPTPPRASHTLGTSRARSVETWATGAARMSDELARLTLVTARLDAAGIPYMLSGSTAGVFGDEIYCDRETIREAVTRQAAFNVIHLPTVIKVDCIVRKDAPYRRAEFGRITGRPTGAWLICSPRFARDRYRPGAGSPRSQTRDGALRRRAPEDGLLHVRCRAGPDARWAWHPGRWASLFRPPGCSSSCAPIAVISMPPPLRASSRVSARSRGAMLPRRRADRRPRREGVEIGPAGATWREPHGFGLARGGEERHVADRLP